MLRKFDDRFLQKNREEIKSKGFEACMIEALLNEIAREDNKTKIKSLAELTGIKVNLGNERWERILEIFARRNCLLHNDLVVNNIYFKQAGQKAEDVSQRKRLTITEEYISNGINDFISLLGEVKSSLDMKYLDRTRVAAVKELWDYLFDNHYPFIFEECWNTDEELISYKGPSLKEIQDASSPRMICLFSAWMSFFGYAYNGDLKHFSTIFYVNAKDRDLYTAKLKYLMDAFEKVDFQGFFVQVYDKLS